MIPELSKESAALRGNDKEIRALFKSTHRDKTLRLYDPN